MKDLIRICKRHRIFLLIFITLEIFFIVVGSMTKSIVEVEIALITFIFTLLTIIINNDHDNNSWLSNKKFEYLEKIIYSAFQYKKIINRSKQSKNYNLEIIKGRGMDLFYSIESNIQLLKNIEKMSKSDYQGSKEDLKELQIKNICLENLLKNINYYESRYFLTCCKYLSADIIKNCQKQMEKSPKIIS